MFSFTFPFIVIFSYFKDKITLYLPRLSSNSRSSFWAFGHLSSLCHLELIYPTVPNILNHLCCGIIYCWASTTLARSVVFSNQAVRNQEEWLHVLGRIQHCRDRVIITPFTCWWGLVQECSCLQRNLVHLGSFQCNCLVLMPNLRVPMMSNGIH